MSIPLNDNIKIQAPKPSEERYLDSLSVPFTSVAAANAHTIGRRYIGLSVNINNTEYWYANGIADTDLLLKSGKSFTKLVFFNSNDPATATIFDTANPPVTNNDTLKADINNLYSGTNGQSWTYKTSPAGYSTYDDEAGGSNFFITGTPNSADGVKTGSITKKGEIVIDSQVIDNSGLILKQIPNSGSTGVTSTVIASMPSGIEDVVKSPDGFYYATSSSTNSVLKIGSNGSVETFASGLNNPCGICIGIDGDLFVCNRANNTISRINKTTRAVSLFVTLPGTFSSPLSIVIPGYICYASDGNFYVTPGNTSSQCTSVAKITPSGVVTKLFDIGIAGPGLGSITQGQDGLLYISCAIITNFVKVTLTGSFTLIPTATTLGICQDSSGAFYTVSLSSGSQVRTVDVVTGATTVYGTITHGSLKNLKYDFENGFIIAATSSSLVKLVPASNKVLKTNSQGKVVKTTHLEDVQYALPSDLTPKEDKANKGVANGYAPTDSNNKIPLSFMNDAILGNLKWKGLYNGSVVSSSPDLPLNGLALPAPSATNVGWYFVSNGTYTNSSKSYTDGDWIISNGVIWDKVDNTDSVSSVFGRTGNIVGVAGDYNADQITETATRVFITPAQKAGLHNSVTLGTPNGLSLSTQVLSLGLASGSQNGALSSADWNTFNGKQNALTNPITGTGLNGQVSFFTGANSQAGDAGFIWDNTNKRLGIGTTVPNAKLDVAVPVNAAGYSLSGYPFLRFISGDVLQYGAFGATWLGLGFLTNNVERIRIDNNGNVGIGGSNPTQQKLGIYSPVNTKVGLYFEKATQIGWRIGIAAGNTNFSIDSNNDDFSTPAISVTSSGNVGIGINPRAKLDVSGGLILALGDNLSWGNTYVNGASTIAATNDSIQFYVGGGAEKMRIANSGSVGIGTNNPGGLMHTYTSSNGIMFRAEVTNTNYPSTLFYGTTVNTAGGYDFIGMYAGGFPKFNVNALGNVISAGTVTATAFYGPSDIRLKDIIETNIGNVSELKPITYTWKDQTKDQTPQLGYSAQEVQKVIPNAVNKDSNGMLSVNYTQVHTAKINSLEDEIIYLKNKVKQLETKVYGI